MIIDKNMAALGPFGVVVAALIFSFIDENTARGLFGVVFVTLIFLSLSISRQIEQIGTKLTDPEHDEFIDKQVSSSLEWYVKRRDQLLAEKQELPRIDLLAISEGRDWERDLIAGAEKLRRFIVEAYGKNSPDFFVNQSRNQDAQKVPLDYNFAHDLAALAHLTNKLSLAENEWLIKKIELLGLMRKRETSLGLIASEEFELRTLEREIEELRGCLPCSGSSFGELSHS